MANLLPKLVITVQVDGTTTTDFAHFAGANCLTASKELHILLAEYGIVTETISMTPKPELLAAPRQPGQVVLTDLTLSEGGM